MRVRLDLHRLARRLLRRARHNQWLGVRPPVLEATVRVRQRRLLEVPRQPPLAVAVVGLELYFHPGSVILFQLELLVPNHDRPVFSPFAPNPANAGPSPRTPPR